MYPQENCNKAHGQLGLMNGQDALISHNPTVGENIDAKIAFHKREIERLEESKKMLAPLLGMRICDIRDAMNY